MTSLDDIAARIPGYDAADLPVPLARDFLTRLAGRIDGIEPVPLRDALGRVLAQDVVSDIDVPAHDNSALDGYALKGADLAAGGETVLEVAGTRMAGDAPIGAAAAGQCVRIMTGAAMPDGFDTVVAQESVILDGSRIRIPGGTVSAGANCRRAGEDLARGQTALRAGRLLRPADIGVLASLGRARVEVVRRLRVAFFSTGNELRSLGEPLAEGCVYDSNRYTLWAMLQRLGVEPVDLGVVRDDPAALEAAFRRAVAEADAVVTTGGVSVGEADYTKMVMASLGRVLFWHVAIRPGRPMAVGRIDSDGRSALLFGLPGNPVAAMVTFYALVRDALLAMAGAADAPLPTLRAATAGPIRKRPGRTEYQRGVVERGAGGWVVRTTGAQGSGILRSMSEANCLVVLERERGAVAEGEMVDVLLFEGLV